MKYKYTSKNIIPFVIWVWLCISFVQAQQNDSLQFSEKESSEYSFHVKDLIIPSALIGYGLISLENDHLKYFNHEIREEVTEHIDDKFTIDDVSQYAPMASVYALNAFGVKGKHNFKDRTIIIGTSFLIMSATTLTLKNITKVQRPDQTAFNSFPSGHTATAFMGAEFLYQEYKDVSPWYGIVGYTIAAGTGIFRMYNNRHWFSDVVAGAGIGILSTKIGYWLYPWMKRKIFKVKRQSINGLAMPFYNGQQAGIGLNLSF